MTARNGHLAALGLVRNPFPYTPDAGCYFSTPHLEEQMVELAHCVQARKGFSLLTAEVGMGKSTLVRRLMTDLASKQVVSALVFNTFLQGPELLAAVLQDFGLTSSGTLSADIAQLNAFLLSNHQEGKTCLLIIDDAQNLTESSLELIRLLCNLETDQEKLLQIMLAGQPELEDTLSQHNLRQLRSRVVKHARLHGLNSTEIADYVKFRFESAGSDGSLVLQADACQILWRETQGVPRQIHLIMDRCLYGLAARNGNVIDAGLMREAIRDSRVELTGTSPGAPVVATARRNFPAWGWVVGGAGVALTAVLAWSQLAPVKGFPALAPAARVGEAPAIQVEAVAASQPSQEAAQPVVASAIANAEAGVLPRSPGVESSKPVESGSCQPRKGWPAGRMVVSQPVPDLTNRLFGSRLARQDDMCFELRQGAVWLSWHMPADGYNLNQRLAVVRFQIALTHFGSLQPNEVDGVWGDKSRAALKQFQTGAGLASTGEINAMSGLLLERFYVQEQ